MLDQKTRERPVTVAPAKPKSYRLLISLASVLALAVVGLSVWGLSVTGQADDLSTDLATAEAQIAGLEAELAAATEVRVPVVESLQRIGSWTYQPLVIESAVPVVESLQRIGSWTYQPVTIETGYASGLSSFEGLLRVGDWAVPEAPASYAAGLSPVEGLFRIGEWAGPEAGAGYAIDLSASEGLARVGSWAAIEDPVELLHRIGEWAYQAEMTK